MIKTGKVVVVSCIISTLLYKINPKIACFSAIGRNSASFFLSCCRFVPQIYV